MFLKKKEKKHVIKGFVSYNAYYPEADMISTSLGYVKAWYLDDAEKTDKAAYEEYLSDMVILPEKDGSTQVCHIAGKDIMTITVPADSARAAEEIFNGLRISARPVSCAEWLNLISRVSLFKDLDEPSLVGAEGKKGRPAASIIGMLQPVRTAMKKDKKGKAVKVVSPKYLTINNRYVKTMALTNFPDYVHSSAVTEILRVSEDISLSMYIRRIDKEKCLKAFDSFKVQMSKLRMDKMKEELHSSEGLYNVSCYLSVSAETEDELDTICEHIKEITDKYLIGINSLEYEQQQAYRCMLPLGINLLKTCKVLHHDDIYGLLPLSWVRHVSRDVSYGIDAISGMEINYNRLMGKASGFVLGSDRDYVTKRIQDEIEQLIEAAPDKKIAVYTINPDPKLWRTVPITMPFITGTPADKEVLRAVTILSSGTNRSLTREAKEAMEEALSNDPDTYDEYVSAFTRKIPTAERALRLLKADAPRYKEGTGCLNLYEVGDKGARYTERVAMLIQALYNTTADIVYVTNADMLSMCGIIPLLMKNRPDVLWTFAMTSYTQDGLRKMYLNRKIARAIGEAGFLDISWHDTTDRIQLKAILAFDKRESSVISSQENKGGLIIMENSTYIYKEERTDTEQEEEEVSEVE